MRITMLVAITVVALGVAACGGSSDSKPTPAPASPPATTAVASPAATRPAQATPSSNAETVEVTGIVGTASASTGLIEIDRISGAPVRRISVDQHTVFRRAAGGTTTLAQIHTSQRIIARGTINDRGDTLIASEVTVQDVVQGGQPGG
jgi:hypothetical protein